MSFFYGWLARLPLPLLYGLGRLARPIIYHLIRYRRRTVAANLKLAYPAASAAERRAIEREFYRHLCDLAAEVIAAPQLSLQALQERVVFENPELLDRYVEQQQSLLLLTCHQGNWEWLLHAVANLLPCPVDGVYKPLHNQGFDRFMQVARSRLGRPIAFQDAAREILRRRREFRTVAMVADQAPFKKDKRHWQDFFGRPASFYLGPQKIAELVQYPVIYVQMVRPSRGYYRVRLSVLAEPPYAKGGTEILDRYVKAIEASVRAQPGTWLWSNRKWKHQPPSSAGTDASREPEPEG